MGWKEFLVWLGVMNRQLRPPEVSPGSWEGADQDPRWQEMRRQRDAMRSG